MSFLITKNSLEHTIYTKELAEKGQLLTHNKDQSILSSCENKYDKDGKLVNQEFNSYKLSNTTNHYDKKNNLILSKNIFFYAL